MSDALLSYTRRGHECVGLFLACFSPFSDAQEEEQIPTMHSVPAVYCTPPRCGSQNNDEAPEISDMMAARKRHLRQKLALQMALLVTSDGVPF